MKFGPFVIWLLALVISSHCFAQTCQDVFATAQPPRSRPRLEDLRFPHQLRVSEDLQTYILNGPYQREAYQIILIYHQLHDPITQSRLTSVFKATPFFAEPQNTSTWNRWLAIQNRVFPEFQQNLGSQILLWNIQNAIRSEFVGEWPPEFQIIVSALLLDLVTPQHFRSPRPPDLSLRTIAHNLPAKVQKVLRNPESRQSLSDFISDRLFRLKLSRISSEAGFDSLVQGHSQKVLLENLKALSILISNENKPIKLRVDSISAYLVTDMISLIVSRGVTRSKHRAAWERGEMSREAFLNHLEDFLFTTVENPQVIEPVIHILDYVLFDSPFPIGASTFSQYLTSQLRNQISPLREEAIIRHRRDAELNSAAAIQRNATRLSETLSTPSRQRPQNLTATPSRKRKQQAQNSTRPTPQPSLLQTAQTTLMESVDELLSETEYTFVMLRQPHEGIQTVIFADSVIEFFDTRVNEPLLPFIRALNYGFTSRSGSNGIKNLTTNMGTRETIYEIRPGNSSFRMIATRTGKTWRVVAIIHKDDVAAYLLQQ